MTFYLLDVASYQGDLRPADVKRAGFDGVNLKVSHGLTRKSVHPNITGWVEQARALELAVSTFHWVTADAPGAGQARYAYDRIAELGLLYGTAHQVDVESTPVPALADVRAYLATMLELLGRPAVLYTGDWWWTARPGWNVADLTPYLWAAPNAGYLGSYPGDASTHWNANYGGWPRLAVMQYAVAPLTFPDGTVGTIKVSKSAIRDASVWRDLTEGRPGMSYAPDTIKAARTFLIATLKTAGFNINPLAVGVVGDDAHANSGTSYHLGKDALKSTAYSIVESSRDRAGLTNAAAAIDIGAFNFTAGGRTHNLRTFSTWLVEQCKAGTADTKDIREVIYSTDGQTVKRWDRLGKRSTGDASHTSHTHISWFRDSENRDKTALLRRYFTEIGVLEDEDMDLTPQNLKDIAGAVWGHREPNPFDNGETTRRTGGDMSYIEFRADARLRSINARLDAIASAVSAVLVNVEADDGDVEALRQAIADAQAATVEGVADLLASPDLTDDQVAGALRAVLGDRAQAVGARLAAG